MRYSMQAVNGEIRVGRKTRQACQRFLYDLGRSLRDPSYPWRYDETLASRPVNFMEKFLVPTKGDYDELRLMD